MSWSMKAEEGGTYEQPPTGPMAAVLTRIIDIGTHLEKKYMSEEFGPKHQVIFMWELADTMTTGDPYTIQKFYTLSTSPKANMRKDLEAWRGKAFEDHEIIEIDAALGKPCLLNITETEAGKSKIASISKLPKGMPAPTPRGPLLLFRTDEPDWSVFEQLSDYHRGRIEASSEYAGMKSHGEQQRDAHEQATQDAAAQSAPQAPPVAEFDDDIPF